MTDTTHTFDVTELLATVEAATRDGKITASASENIRKWLTERRYADYFAQVAEHIADGKWQQLDDVFWRVIPFGTGGRRGRMYPIGCNAINDRTIGASAQGLADYVKEHHEGDGELACAIAYDTRHNSRHFAELCAGVMVAAGFRVYFLDDYRSTPALSFTVRQKKCSCGIMVTASHNPPSDNAVKVYWSTGGQVLPPHDKAIIQCVMGVEDIQAVDFQQAVADGNVIICTDEVDEAFTSAVIAQRRPGPRDLRIIYSPLHGVGASAVCPVLAADGFTDVEVFGPQEQPDGNFTNVPGHVSNPERPAVFDAIIERAAEIDADLILATDPDCDRMGCAAPLTLHSGEQWAVFTGNQIGALLADFVLSGAKGLTPDDYLVKTLVTTEMVRRIGDSYGVRTYGDLLVGFKWIGGLMDKKGPDKFLLGLEESHGYLAGGHARDKDGAVACMLMAELAASAKAAGESLHERLDDLYRAYGYHAETQLSLRMEGSEGMSRMKSLMRQVREKPPQSLGGIQVVAVRDYRHGIRYLSRGGSEPLEGPIGDIVILDLADDGNYVAVRPSGTEPKVKFYMFVYVPAGRLADLAATKGQMAERLASFEVDLRAFSESV
jgi:phosphoglucomutase/phosphomannomutase